MDAKEEKNKNKKEKENKEGKKKKKGDEEIFEEKKEDKEKEKKRGKETKGTRDEKKSKEKDSASDSEDSSDEEQHVNDENERTREKQKNDSKSASKKEKDKNVYGKIERKEESKRLLKKKEGVTKRNSSSSSSSDQSEEDTSGKGKKSRKVTAKDEEEDREKRGESSKNVNVSKERTKDLEDFKGAKDTKGSEDKIQDTAIIDETGAKNEEEIEKILTVKDLVEMMNIMMISQKRLGNPHLLALGDISSKDISLPAIIDKIDPEFTLKYDSLSKWCVFQGRLRQIDEFKTYDSFLLNYINNIHAVTSEFYRIFRISERVNLQNLRVIPPEIVGSYAEWNKIQKTNIIQGFYDNAALFIPIKEAHGYRHRIFLNPCLKSFSDMTQDFLFANDAGRILRDWIDIFSRRKQHKTLIGLDPVYGDTSTVWLRCSHPRILPQLLGSFPNVNYISIMYGSQFSYPEIRLSVLDVSSLSAAMSLTIAADGMNTIVMASPTSSNFDDFQRIVLAMLFPIQIQIEIKYSTTAAPGIDACSALCAKLLLSSSPLSRNVTKASCYHTDLVISNWLVRFGYQRRNINAPLELTYAVRGQPNNIRDSIWITIATANDAGTGWVNMLCDDFSRIDQPLYNDVNRLPQYGGITAYFDSEDFGDSAVLNDNPIWLAIDRGLQELMSMNMRAANQMRGYFSQLRTKYLEYLAKLNRYISIYGENGFRLTDDIINMMAVQDPIGILAEETNNPELITINSDSLFKFFKQLPNEFNPPQRIIKQPAIESLVSQELQRVISMFFTISDRVIYDHRQSTVKSKMILKTVVSSSLISHVAKSIFESAFRGYNISRVRERVLRVTHGLRDDFFANFYSELNLIIINNPEAFGLVNDIIRIRRPIERLNPAETEKRSMLGIITSNVLPLLPEGLILRRYSLGEVREAENRLSLLTELYGDGTYVVSLPIPTRYVEQLCARFGDLSLPYTVNFYEETKTRFISSETIEYGTFTAQFVSPNPNPRPFPDQILMGADSLLFWKLGGTTFTMTANTDNIFTNWFQTMVFSYEKYVKFANPLQLLVSAERE